METVYKLGAVFSLRDRFTGGMSRIQGMTKRFQGALRKTGMMITGMGLAAGLAMAPAIKTYAGFEKTMTAVGSVSGATEEQMRRLENRAIELGIKTEHSSVAAAQGFYELSKAGFTVNEQLKAIRPSLLLATAGQLELGTATRTMSAALKSFGLDSDQAGRATDVLIKGAQISMLSAGEYEMALGTLGSSAVAAGQKFEPMMAMLAAMRNTGKSATRSAEQIRIALLALQAPTGGAAKEISALSRDASGNLLPFADVVDRVQAKLKGLGKTARDAAIVKIFGREGIAAYQVAVSTKYADPVTGEVHKGTAALRRMEQAMKRSQNTGQLFANRFLGTISGKTQQLAGSLETFMNVVGKLFSKNLEPWVVSFTKGLNVMIDWVRENPKSAQQLADTAAQTAVLATAIGGLLLSLTLVMFLLKPFAAMASLFLLSPFWRTAMVVMVLVGAITILVRRWGDLKEKMRDMGPLVQRKWDQFKEWTAQTGIGKWWAKNQQKTGAVGVMGMGITMPESLRPTQKAGAAAPAGQLQGGLDTAEKAGGNIPRNPLASPLPPQPGGLAATGAAAPLTVERELFSMEKVLRSERAFSGIGDIFKDEMGKILEPIREQLGKALGPLQKEQKPAKGGPPAKNLIFQIQQMVVEGSPDPEKFAELVEQFSSQLLPSDALAEGS